MSRYHIGRSNIVAAVVGVALIAGVATNGGGAEAATPDLEASDHRYAFTEEGVLVVGLGYSHVVHEVNITKYKRYAQ